MKESVFAMNAERSSREVANSAHTETANGKSKRVTTS